MLDQTTIYGIISLVNFFTCLFIGAFLLVKNPNNPINISYCAFDFCVAFYAFFYFLWQSSSDVGTGILFFKWCIFGVVLINSAFVHFTYVILGIDKKLKGQLLFTHALNAFFCYSALSLFYADWKIKYTYGLWPIPSRIFHIYIVWWFLQVIYCFYLIQQKGVLKSSGKQQRQYRWIFWATLIAYAGGSTNWFVWYGINFPPYLNSGIAIYTIVLAYAIFRHQLLDIEVIIKKTLVFTGLFGMVLGVVGLVTTVMQYVGDKYLAIPQMVSTAVSVCLAIIFYDPTRKLLVRLTDKFLFQKAYDYQKILKDASRGMSRIESLSHLLGLVIHFITMKMRIKSAAVLQWNRAASEFAIGHQRGYAKKFLHYKLKCDHPLIAYFSQEKEAITIELVKDYIQAGGKKRVKGERPHEYDFTAIQKAMEDLQAACCVPSFLGKELCNILVLGYKKSDYPFTNEDITVLFTLAQESAIAIENARLFDEAITKNEELRSINEQLGYSKALLMKALKETEVANKQLQDTQAQLIHEQKMATLGRLAASVGHEVNNPLTILSMNVSRAILKYRKNPELKVAAVLELFQKMEQNIGRIKAVVNTLTGLLKKSEKGKFEPLSLKLILEETLPLVQFQTYLDNLTGTEVEFDIPGSVPLIRGDLERLQEVFLNLFINAYHAMMGRRNRRIRVTAEIEPDNPHMVGIHFIDNGSGMSEDVMKKIFNYGYTTKPPGKGSGMGLYMCKYIIELHGGDIKVKSTLGVGTTFTLTLPIHEETGTETGDFPMRATS